MNEKQWWNDYRDVINSKTKTVPLPLLAPHSHDGTRTHARSWEKSVSSRRTYRKIDTFVHVHVEFEALTMVAMKSCIIRDTAQCRPMKTNLRFEGIFSLHLQSWRVNQARNQQEAQSAVLAICFILVYCSAYSWVLKNEAIFSSERLFDFQRTT
jgi:hypothetical protein